MALKKTLKISGLVLLLLIILTLLFLPMAAKNYAISNSKALLGRQIDIGSLKLNYFTGTLKIIDFKMFESDEINEFVSLDTLILDTEPYRYIRKELVIEQFYIKGLVVNAIQQDSTFNFNDLLEFHASQPSDTIQVEPVNSDPLEYILHNLELKNANFIFNDKNVDHITSFENFSFRIPYISWNQEEKSNADLKFNFKDGGYFASSLNLHPVDGEFDALITINDLYLNSFYKYVSAHAEINSFNGHFNSEINITGNMNHVENAIVSGNLSVNDFEITDTNDKIVLGVKSFNTNLKKIDYANKSYIIDSLSISESYTYFQLDSITNNFATVFKLDTETKPQDSISKPEIDTIKVDNSSEKLYYAVNHFNVNRGVLDYTDNLTGEAFNYHLSEIQINSDSISSESDWVNIYAEMLLNNRGTLKAKLGANPLNTENAELDITIEKFLLSDINIYSRHYLSHDILEGDFYYHTTTKIVNGEITSENKLTIKDVSVLSTETGLYSLPLKFAIFLLKDKNGDVVLDVPIRGDMNDPTVDIGKIVATTFKNLILKTVASPIKFLGGLVGGDPKDLEEIEFTYQDTLIVGKPQKQLDKLLELEQKKDGLGIQLQHYVDLELQKEAIALSELGTQFNIETQNDYLKDQKAFETYLITKAGSDSISAEAAILKLSGNTNLDSLARQYNSTLLKNTKAYLFEKNPHTKIEVLNAKPEEPEQVGSKSRFKIKYDMLEVPNDIKNDTL